MAEGSVEERVKRICCPEHHQTPRLHFTGSGDKMSWQVEGCCRLHIWARP